MDLTRGRGEVDAKMGNISDTKRTVAGLNTALENILKTHGGKFSDIPMNSPYWSMVNQQSRLQSDLKRLGV